MKRTVAKNEIDFTKHALIALRQVDGVRVWRQNCGEIPIRDQRGNIIRYFDAGPPKGAADISGGVSPHGRRLEIELKMPRGKRTAEQINWAEFCQRMGFVYVLCTYVEAQTLAENCDRLVRLVAAAIEMRGAA